MAFLTTPSPSGDTWDKLIKAKNKKQKTNNINKTTLAKTINNINKTTLGSVLGPILFVLYTTPLSDIIANHSVNHQLFADDTQLQKSAPLNEVTNLTKELNACTDNIKTWMTENELKLNDDKTEALLFPFSSSLKPSTGPLPDSITLGSHNIPFSDSSRNLGFILDSKLSMKKHIIKICQTAYFELKCISSIRRFLTEDATKTRVTSYILSRLGYCNCLLMGTPNSVIQPLQKIQNFAARLVLLAPCHHHATPLLEKLHWLPISERIKYKVACMCVSAINGSGPAYLSNCCMSTLHLVHCALLLTPARWKSNNTNARLMASALSLALDPTFGIHSHKTLDTAQPCHLLKPNWKPSSSHSISILTNISTQFLLQSVYARVCVCVCVCVCVFVVRFYYYYYYFIIIIFYFLIILYVNCFGRTMLYMCIEYHI